jgi:hypothetical protein
LALIGGDMDRSYSRLATLIGGAATVGLLLAGCASTAPGGAVLGVPRTETSAPAQTSGDVLAGLEQAITNELNAVNATQSADQAPEALIELNALNSPSSLIKAENFEKLISLGTNQLVKREQIVNALISEVGGNNYVSTVSVAGRNLRGSLVEMLETVNGQLGALVGSISSATLTDVVRADVTSINASTRVYGLVEPQVHLALAGGDMLAELNALAGQAKTLASSLASAGSTDPSYAKDLALLQELNRAIPAAQTAVSSALASVLALTPAGFPGNKATIVAARSTFTALRSPGGALGTAIGDASEISVDLGLGA